MYKHLIFFSIIICSIGLFLVNNNPLFAEEKETTMLNSFERDLTGDSFEEYIQLHGDSLKDDGDFYQNIWITIKNKFDKEWSVALQHGYQPDISLVDLTGDKHADIFYSVAKDNGLAHYNYQLFQMKDNALKSVALPEHTSIQTTYGDDFTLNVSINPTENPMTLDLAPYKDIYINERLYQSDGHFTGDNTPKVGVNPTVSPLLISHSKGYGIKTIYRIYGAQKEKVLGELETIWYFKNDKWINMQTTLNPKT